MSPFNLAKNESSEFIGDVVRRERVVIYDEMAEYGLRYIDRESSSKTINANVDAKYHIRNLVLLSMYFDVIYILTSSIMNIRDPYLVRVIQITLNNAKIQCMMNKRVIRFCGWGGRTPDEIFSNAVDFASSGTDLRQFDGYLSLLSNLFVPSLTAFRADYKPDSEASNVFRAHLNDTETIRSTEDVSKIDDAIMYSEKTMGQLTAIGFTPALRSSSVPQRTRDTVFRTYLNSWVQHLNRAIPEACCYMPGIWPESFHDIINFGGRSVHSFLYSPQIFFFFLQQHFNLNELNRILSQPYEKIFLLRNGDWQRFCAGYHEAIIIMSQSITEVGLALYEDSPRANAEFWAKQLMELSKSDRYSFDIKAFIQGLAAISGVLLSLPLISPASRMVSALFGRRLENLYSSTIGERQDKVSPFIRKVRKSIELQANLA